MRKFVALISLALVSAACGGGASSETFESLEAGPSGTITPSTSAPAPSTTTPTTAADTTDTSAAPVAPPAPADTAELPESDYPDVVVADLAGGEVNLRELALESEPVLLWFWAPH